MRCAWLLATSGCLFGGGPTIALRDDHRITAGWELDAATTYGGVEIGESIELGSGGTSVGYVAATGSLLAPLGSRGTVALDGGARGEVGAWIGHLDDGTFIGGAPMIAAFTRTTCPQQDGFYASLRVGVRELGHHVEIYAAPTVAILGDPFACN
jgi:hypothetical protein